jgi:processive 1,2-diacylglycerol beta-glucosyltransferase
VLSDRHREVLTFLAVGGAGYIVDVLAFNWLRTQPGLAGLDPTVSKVLAVSAAMVVTYLGNRMLTWRDQAPTTERRREISLFVLFNVVGLGISVALLALTHDVLGLTSRLADNLSANVVGLALGTAFRYWSYRRFVFAPPTDVPVRPSGDPATVHIVSGSYGAGHDAAAREIELRLVDAGHVVRRWDVVDLFPARLGRLLRWGYFEQLQLSPGSWGLLLQRLQPGRVAYRVAVHFLALPGHRIRAIAADGAVLFISTHPFASQALGRLRSTGRLDVPVVTYLTDASVHPLWVNPGVDLHLALHDVAADQARALGGTTTVVEPLVPRAYRDPVARSVWELRARLGLPVEDDLALVVGGSHGVGDLEAAATDIAATGLARPVVACGHNEVLRRRLELRPGLIALGWRDDMPDLIRASSCVVQNAGGFTSLEAMAAGVPVISYRCLPGHGTTNAAALEQSGLVPWARDSDELAHALVRAIATPRHLADLPAVGAQSVLDALPLRSPMAVG